MARICNFYADRGADFDANIQILGINNRPVSLSGWKFMCQAYLIRNPKMRINIDSHIFDESNGWINLHIPYNETNKMAPGEWTYDVEMSYDNLPEGHNRRLRVVQGRIIVNNQVTTCF